MRESKNSNRAVIVSVLSFLISPSVVWAAGSDIDQQTLPIIASLLFVLVVIIAAALLLKKFNLGMMGAQNGDLKVIASLSLGPKERIMVIEVNGEQQLLGVTAHSISLLQTLKEPLPQAEKGNMDFAEKLQQMMKKS